MEYINRRLWVSKELTFAKELSFSKLGEVSFLEFQTKLTCTFPISKYVRQDGSKWYKNQHTEQNKHLKYKIALVKEKPFLYLSENGSEVLCVVTAICMQYTSIQLKNIRKQKKRIVNLNISLTCTYRSSPVPKSSSYGSTSNSVIPKIITVKRKIYYILSTTKKILSEVKIFSTPS